MRKIQNKPVLLKNHLIILLELVLGKKTFFIDKFWLGKPIQILTKSTFLAFSTKKGSYNLILYYFPFFLPNLALGFFFILVVF